jgi:hypothetical protein
LNNQEFTNEQQTPDPKRKWILLFIPLCVVMGVLEAIRAFSGNSRSWVYMFEWPFFGLFIYYMYWKLQHPEENFRDFYEKKRKGKDE